MSTTPRGFLAATADDVREFAAANGLPYGGSRGRLPKATIEAFNKAHSKGKGRKHYGGTVVGLREYTLVGPKGGRKSVAEKSAVVRSWGRLNGWEVADRGRLPAALMEEFVKANA